MYDGWGCFLGENDAPHWWFFGEEGGEGRQMMLLGIIK
jgi:hypothetical protein